MILDSMEVTEIPLVLSPKEWTYKYIICVPLTGIRDESIFQQVRVTTIEDKLREERFRWLERV